MIREKILGEMCVRDVRELVVKLPAVIGPDALIDDLLQATIADPRTRHVYVVDQENHLIGSARMNAVVEYLFPFAAGLEKGVGLSAPPIDWSEKKVCDIMNDEPAFVTEDDRLDDAAALMMREKINELPVIDHEHKVIGQINMYEIIQAFLREKGR